MRIDLNIAAIEQGVCAEQRYRAPLEFDDLIVVGEWVYVFRDGVLLGITDSSLAGAEA